jgi:hypothetical protein
MGVVMMKSSIFNVVLLTLALNINTSIGQISDRDVLFSEGLALIKTGEVTWVGRGLVAFQTISFIDFASKKKSCRLKYQIVDGTKKMFIIPNNRGEHVGKELELDVSELQKLEGVLWGKEREALASKNLLQARQLLPWLRIIATDFSYVPTFHDWQYSILDETLVAEEAKRPE